MKKRILITLSIVLVASAVIVGSAIAYFGDKEVITSQVVKAGTIDISLSNPRVTMPATNLDDLKPGETQYIEFDVVNTGVNPVKVRKHLLIDKVLSGGGILSEPECEEGEGTWDGTNCGTPYAANDNLLPAIVYDMTVKNDGGDVVTVIPEKWDIGMNEVESLWMPLGTLEAGKTMTVKQSYKLDEQTTNWAQGDTVNFDIEIYGEQRMGPGLNTDDGVVLENKTGNPNWDDVIDGTWGLLNFNKANQTYTFQGFGLEANKLYRLTYRNGAVGDPIDLMSGTTDASGNLVLNGTNLPATLTNGAFDLMYDGSLWGDDLKNLWEGNLVTY